PFANPEKEEQAKGTWGKAGGKGQQRRDEASRRVDSRKEVWRQKGGHGAVQVEVVPLEHGAQGGGNNNLTALSIQLVLGFGDGSTGDCLGHVCRLSKAKTVGI